MDPNKDFFKNVRSDRARFFLCDLHVHSPGSRDLVEGERFEALSECEKSRLGCSKNSNLDLAVYEAELLDRNIFPVEDYLNQVVARRDSVLDSFQSPDGDRWGIIAVTDHNVCSYACRLAAHAWNTRNDCRLIVLPGIELDVVFPVQQVQGQTSAHVLLIFAPTISDRNIYSAIREASATEWDFGAKLTVASLPDFIRKIRDHNEFPAITIAAHVDTGKGLQARAITAIRETFRTPEAEFARLAGELNALLKSRSLDPGILTWEMTEVQQTIQGMEKEVDGDDSVPLRVLELIGHCGFDALQVQREASGRHYRRLHRFERHIGRAVPVVCSDAHRVADIFACKNGETPFIKMTAFSDQRSSQDIFQELRSRAVRFGETRFAQRPPGSVSVWISGIEISPDSKEAKLFWPFSGDDSSTFRLPLSRNLNCLIGGRGSGKSAAIEAISFASQPDFLEGREAGQFLDDCRRRAAATLAGCNIRLCWTCLDEQGKFLPKKAIFSTRYFNESGRHERISYSDLNNKEIPSAHLPVEIFRLREIEELVDNPERLRGLFDSLCGDQIADMTAGIAALVGTLRSRQSRLIEIAKELCRLTKEGSPLRTYSFRKQQYDSVNSDQVRETYQRLDEASLAADVTRRASDNWKSICDDLDMALRKQQIETFFDETEAAALDEQGQLRPYLSSVGELVGKAEPSEQRLKQRVIQAANQFEDELSAVTIAATTASSATSAVVKDEREKLANEGLPVGGKEREAKKQDFDEATVALESYRRYMSEWEQEVKARMEMFADLEAKCRDRTSARLLKATEITASLRRELDPKILVIEIDARPMADKREFETWINSHLYPPNTRSKEARTLAMIGDGMMPSKLRNILLGQGELPPVERDSVAGGQISKDTAKSFTDFCWGMRKFPPEKQESEIGIERWCELPVEIREGLICFPSAPNDDARLDEKRLAAVLELDEIVFDDLPEIRLMDRPTEMTATRPLQELSPGQRCSAILPILLLNGTCPLIIDQPEDNLDNRLIREVVVKILASIKLKRQVIIATHNPNLPVLGDVEQTVILRAVEDNKCQLQATGNLDEAHVVRLITEIMEGGREAFQYRHSIYQPYWEGPVDDDRSA